MNTHVQALTEAVYQVVRSALPKDGTTATVKLRDGGVLVTAENGDHVHVLVQPVHFVPGEELPF